MDSQRAKSPASLTILKSSPPPFFDSLESMPNPWRSPVTDLFKILGHSSAGALTDFQKASEFLYYYRGSADTFNAYRREIEHLLYWCWLVRGTSILQITPADFDDYVEFARYPPKAWIGSSAARRFITQDNARIVNPVLAAVCLLIQRIQPFAVFPPIAFRNTGQLFQFPDPGRVCADKSDLAIPPEGSISPNPPETTSNTQALSPTMGIRHGNSPSDG